MSDNPYDGMMDKMNIGDTFHQTLKRNGKMYVINVQVVRDNDGEEKV